MKKIRTFLAILFISFLAISCSQADNKLAFKSQRLLDESDVLMERHDYNNAFKKVQQAQSNLNVLISKHRNNADYLILHARANFNLFLIKNVSVFNAAKQDPLSLTALPKAQDYISRDKYLLPAIINLNKILNSPDTKPTSEQIIAANVLLASIYRLDEKTLDKAINHYQTAISIYVQQLQDLRAEETKLSPKTHAIAKKENEIRNIQMAMAEIYILKHKWEPALFLLEDIAGGPDLKYFDTHFALLQNKLAEAEKQMQLKQASDTKKSKTKNFIKKKSSSDISYSTEEAAIMQIETTLTALKNNLIYRIICFYHLKRNNELKEAREILRQYYPEVDAKVMQELDQSNTY